MWIAALTFVVVFAVVIGPYLALVEWPERQEQEALRSRLGRSEPQRPASTLLLERPEERYSRLDLLNNVLRRTSAVSRRVDALLKGAGLRASVGAVILLSGVSGLGAYVLADLVSGRNTAVGAGVVAAVVPYLALRYARNRQLARFEEQFPEAVELLARSLRAGHALPVGLGLVAEEMHAPLSTEFKLLHDRHAFGMPLPEALRELAVRMPLPDTRFFVTAVLTQRETGGNLAEVLDNLASVVRDRFTVKRQVRVATAHARMTGWILAALPPALSLLTWYVMPEHIGVLFEDPLGQQLVAGAVALQILGTVVVRRMVKVPY